MNFHVMTLFPEMFDATVHSSILGRGEDKGLISIQTYDIRAFSEDKHHRVDDYPYGGGAGMLMAPAPVFSCYQYIKSEIKKENTKVVYLTPQGKCFNQQIAKELSAEDDLILLCGHYEGIDERVLEMIVTDNISIGDYVLTGGELPAMVIIDTVSRLIPGVLSNEESSEFESFHDNLLEYPQYTRPPEFMGKKVPEILLTGHHANIEKWRYEQSKLRTSERRPDLVHTDKE